MSGTRVFKAGNKIVYTSANGATIIKSTLVIIITVCGNVFIDTSSLGIAGVFSASIIIITVNITVTTSDFRRASINSTFIVIVTIYRRILAT